MCKKRGTHMYPESTTLITEIKSTVVELKPETYMVLQRNTPISHSSFATY